VTKRRTDVVFQPVMRSLAMRQLDRVLRTVAPKDVIVTLVGESGTGKEILARRVHELSDRHDGPFVPINCAAIPEALFESELFGHEKGAFTGASDRVRGKIESATGGTLFLDEIGEMPLAAQAKMLRFLENKRFMRVGGSVKITADLRLVTATFRPLEEEVRAGRFRADLFYRIEGITLDVPPLRERIADIAPLVHELVAQSSAKHGTKPPRLARATMAALREYSWPGNVRELQNAVQLLCLLREGKPARPSDLPVRIQKQVPMKLPSTAPNGGASTREIIEIRLDEPLDASIERILAAALALEGGNRSRAAARLSVGLRTVQRHASRTRTRPRSK
jgi:DNA-binding NtrC family response regulator